MEHSAEIRRLKNIVLEKENQGKRDLNYEDIYRNKIEELGLDSTNEQAFAFLDIMQWVEDENANNIFDFAGYAGTGKTTLICQVLASVLKDMGRRVVFISNTNKAVSVLKTKLPEHEFVTKTLCKLLYVPYNVDNSIDIMKLKDQNRDIEEKITKRGDKSNSKLTALLNKNKKHIDELKKQEESINFKSNEYDLSFIDLVVVDESSQVKYEDGVELINRCKKILFVGDRGQLPPPKSDAFIKPNSAPNINLKTVQRQVEDSGILWLATQVRENPNDKLNKYIHEAVERGGVSYCNLEDLDFNKKLYKKDPIKYNNSHQIITSTHFQKYEMARMFREKIMGVNDSHAFIPRKGDKIICTLTEREEEPYVISGMQCNVLKDAEYKYTNTFNLVTDYECEQNEKINIFCRTVHFEDFYFGSSKLPKDITTKDPKPCPLYRDKHGYTRDDLRDYIHSNRLEHHDVHRRSFQFSQAIVCHAAQGSEWDNVYIVADSGIRRWMKDDTARWWYTAITRAKKHVTIVNVPRKQKQYGKADLDWLK